MSKRIALVAALAAIVLVAPSYAADVPLPPQYKAPVVATPLFNWTGFYGGAHAGFGWANTDHSTPSFSGYSLSSGPSSDGFLFGLDVMALYQFPNSPVVAGLAVSQSWGGLDGSSGITLSGPAGCGFCGPVAGASYKFSLDDIGTAKGVLGYSTGRWLPYLTAGVAWAEGNATASSGGGSVKASDDLVGWTAGLGVLWAYNQRVSLGLDYSYLRFSGGDYSFKGFGPFAITAGGRTDAHVIKALALWKF